MALYPATDYPGLRHDGVRRMDHLVPGFITEPERLSGFDRIRSDVPGSQVRRNYHSFVAWAAVALASASGGSVITLVVTRGGF